MKIYLDASIILEVFCSRGRAEEVKTKLAELVKYGAELYISTLSVNFVLYFAEKENYSKEAAWNFLQAFSLGDVLAEDIDMARRYDAGDFEDALQVAVARREGAELFVTLDKAIQKMYGQYIDVVTVGQK